MRLNLFIFCTIFACSIVHAAPTITCAEGDAPQNIQPLSDMNLTAKQDVQIQASPAFTGKYIAWSISAPVTNPTNIIMIDRRKGGVFINAQAAEEKFVVTVTASSPCGSASTSFNVTIAPADAYE